jgi:hypothetical protein
MVADLSVITYNLLEMTLDVNFMTGRVPSLRHNVRLEPLKKYRHNDYQRGGMRLLMVEDDPIIVLSS